MRHSNHIINVLTFPYPKEEKTFGFKTTKTNGESPLRKSEYPKELWSTHKHELQNIDRLYCDFRTTENCKYITPVDLTKSLFFSKHYYNFLIHEYFKKVADVVYPNFIRQNEIWFKSINNSTSSYTLYYKFTLTVQLALVSGLPELVVAFDGTSRVSKKSIHDLTNKNINTDLCKTVIYNKKIYKYKELPKDANNHLSEIHPILRTELIDALRISLPSYKKNENKYRDYFEKIDHLLKKYLNTPEFKKIIPHSGNWLELEDDTVLNTIEGTNLLKFGNGTHTDPYEGIKQHNPCDPVPIGHYKYFFICHESDVQTAKLFHKYAKREKGFINFSKFLSMPITYDKDKHIIFKNLDNPLPEIEAALENTSLIPNTNYIAIYISPYNKHEPDPEKRNYYYWIKQLLLRYKISSQVVFNANVTKESFKYSVTNIAVAILAKLGGIPWRLDRELNDELIIGIGAFKSNKFNTPFLANTFCFSNDGSFKEFDSFPADNKFLLAGVIKDAVEEYHNQNKEASRIIIHFYKRMSDRDLRPILKTLRSLKYDIPVIIITINKTESNDLVFFDTQFEGMMPYSGSYMSIGRNSYILCNNTRYKPNNSDVVEATPQKPIKSYPLPIKLHFQSSDNSIIEDKNQIRLLIDQVYQFSRMYWKSVSQQNLPVTIKYPEMIAEMYPHFKGKKIPEFGKTNLWFL